MMPTNAKRALQKRCRQKRSQADSYHDRRELTREVSRVKNRLVIAESLHQHITLGVGSRDQTSLPRLPKRAD